MSGLLGYVIQLITLANLVARRRKSAQVEVPDVRRVYTLYAESGCAMHSSPLLTTAHRFQDEKRSVQYLQEQNSLLIGDDGTVGTAEDKMEV